MLYAYVKEAAKMWLGLLKKSIRSAKMGGWALFFASLRRVWHV